MLIEFQQRAIEFKRHASRIHINRPEKKRAPVRRRCRKTPFNLTIRIVIYGATFRRQWWISTRSQYTEARASVFTNAFV